MSGGLDDDNSVRIGMRQDSGSDVGSMPIEKKYNWTLVLPPSFNPREENSLQPVDEQNFCHKVFLGRSYDILVLFMHFKIRDVFFSTVLFFGDKEGWS
jgi:hypothetical protein